MEIQERVIRMVLWVTLACLPAVAWAHPGDAAAGGLIHGLMHPIGGLDHVLAMVGVGLIAACMGGRGLVLVPASFLAMMVVGTVVGASGLPALPPVEIGITASVIVIGVLVAVGGALPIATVMALVGGFALLHGVAHGAGIAGNASGIAYVVGVTAATAILHALGAGLGLGMDQLRRSLGRYPIRIAGTAISLAGLGILAQAM